MSNSVHLVCGYDNYGDKCILYCSLDKSKAKEYAIERMKNKDRVLVDKALEQISKYKTELDTLESTISVLNKQDYYGRDEFVQKIKARKDGLNKRISIEEKIFHRDYVSDFEYQCNIHSLYLAEIELDSKREFCIDDFL